MSKTKVYWTLDEETRFWNEVVRLMAQKYARQKPRAVEVFNEAQDNVLPTPRHKSLKSSNVLKKGALYHKYMGTKVEVDASAARPLRLIGPQANAPDPRTPSPAPEPVPSRPVPRYVGEHSDPPPVTHKSVGEAMNKLNWLFSSIHDRLSDLESRLEALESTVPAITESGPFKELEEKTQALEDLLFQSKEPKTEPEPDKKKDTRPVFGLFGPLPMQVSQIKSRIPDAVFLHIRTPKNTPVVDHVFVAADFVSHKDTPILENRYGRDNVTNMRGGITSWVRCITEHLKS